MTKLEATVTQLVNNAAKSDLKATVEVTRWAKEFGVQEILMNPPSLTINFRRTGESDDE